MQKCAAFRGAEVEISERITRLETDWLRSSHQLEFVRRIAHLLDDGHLNIHNQALEVLLGKLKIASLRLESVLERKTLDDGTVAVKAKRGTYARRKSGIDKAIDELETWQKITDPFWYLMLRVGDSEIDKQLANSTPLRQHVPSSQTIRDGLKAEEPNGMAIFRSDDEIRSARLECVAFCDSRVVHRRDTSKLLVMDTVPCPREATKPMVATLTKDVRDLARKLRHVDAASFGLLSCKGVVRHFEGAPGSSAQPRPIAFSFIFAYPDGLSRTTSLRARLLAGDTLHTLSERFRLAKDLARAVSYVHTFGFVHKNIRPETVLIMSAGDGAGGPSGPSAFLVGFQNVRTAEGRTLRCGDQDWEKNLYRHWRRRGAPARGRLHHAARRLLARRVPSRGGHVAVVRGVRRKRRTQEEFDARPDRGTGAVAGERRAPAPEWARPRTWCPSPGPSCPRGWAPSTPRSSRPA